MEKTTLDALDWKLSAGTFTSIQPSSADDVPPADDKIAPTSATSSPYHAEVNVRRRFQFSSTLKRMSTISVVTVDKTPRVLIAVKGAPETLKAMFTTVPDEYEATYKWYAQRGSRVLALGYRFVDNMNRAQVCSTIPLSLLVLTRGI
jgi:cation-transporting ATPase 13A1